MISKTKNNITNYDGNIVMGATASQAEYISVLVKFQWQLLETSYDDCVRWNTIGVNHDREQKVTAYLSQVLFTQYPPQAMGVRNSRELLTLAEAIDQLMAENFASVGDILMQTHSMIRSLIKAHREAGEMSSRQRAMQLGSSF